MHAIFIIFFLDLLFFYIEAYIPIHHQHKTIDGYRVTIDVKPTNDEIIYADGIGFYSNNAAIEITDWKAQPKAQNYYDPLRKISVSGWKQQVSFEVQIDQPAVLLDHIQLWYTLHTNQKKSSFHTIMLKSPVKKTVLVPTPKNLTTSSPMTVSFERNIRPPVVNTNSWLDQFSQWITYCHHLINVCALIMALLLLFLIMHILVHQKTTFLLWGYCCIAYILWFFFWYVIRIATVPFGMSIMILTVQGILLQTIKTPFFSDRFLGILSIAGAIAVSCYNAQLMWYY